MTELIINSDNELIELAYSLGRPISSRLNSSLIDNLVPLNNTDAHKQSLSANFGTGYFPFHTDGAYFKIPPKFIILRFVNGIQNPTPTILCDLNQLTKEVNEKLKDCIWKVRSRNNEFLTTILSENGEFYRYDKCVMYPMISKSQNGCYFDNLIEKSTKIQIEWTLNKTVIINNWTFLHSRPKVTEQEINTRTIQRIMIL